jgi:hypothetical protein
VFCHSSAEVLFFLVVAFQQQSRACLNWLLSYCFVCSASSSLLLPRKCAGTVS